LEYYGVVVLDAAKEMNIAPLKGITTWQVIEGTSPVE
jgi:hypothetical protein